MIYSNSFKILFGKFILHVSARDYFIFKRAKEKANDKAYHAICVRMMKRYMMLHGKATVNVDCKQIILYERRKKKTKK